MKLFGKNSSSKSLLESTSTTDALIPNQKSIIEVPDELRNALLDFSVAFLMNKPKDVIDYAVSYFTNMQIGRTKMRPTIITTFPTRSGGTDLNRLTIDQGRRSFRRTSEIQIVERRIIRHSVLDNMRLYRSFSEQRTSTEQKSVSIQSLEPGDTTRKSSDLRSPARSRDFTRRSSDKRASSTFTISHYWYRTEPLARRKSVFAESFNPDDIEDIEETLPYMGPKSPELRKRLKNSIKNILLFHSLDSQQLHQLLDAMVERRVTSGDVVTLQGSPAKDLFVIDKGIFKVYRDNVHVYTFHNHGVFGELALMSSRVRLATIIANTDGILWSIDRHTFRRILLTKAYHNRNFYEQQLRKVHMLQVLTKYQLMNLADALKEATYRQGDVIFKAGDSQTGMYIVIEGIVQIKAVDKNGIEKEVRKIGESENFFGELSLLKIQPKRIMSAYAASRIVKLAFLSIDSFERVVGDSLEVVKRSIDLSHPHYSDIAELYRSKNIDIKL